MVGINLSLNNLYTVPGQHQQRNDRILRHAIAGGLSGQRGYKYALVEVRRPPLEALFDDTLVTVTHFLGT